jgi:hypothetical protein
MNNIYQITKTILLVFITFLYSCEREVDIDSHENTYTRIFQSIHGQAADFVKTSDRGLILAILSAEEPRDMYLLVKVNSDGIEQWRKTFHKPEGDDMIRLTDLNDGNFLLSTKRNTYIMFFNEDGTILNEGEFIPNENEAVVSNPFIDKNGTIWMSIYFYNQEKSEIYKINRTGIAEMKTSLPIFIVVPGSPYNIYNTSSFGLYKVNADTAWVRITGQLITKSTNVKANGLDVMVIKIIISDGTIIGQNKLSSEFNKAQYSESVYANVDHISIGPNNFILTRGRPERAQDSKYGTRGGGRQFFLYKLNSDLELAWKKTYEFPESVSIRNLTVNTRNEIFVTGTYIGKDLINGLIMFIDQDGNVAYQNNEISLHTDLFSGRSFEDGTTYYCGSTIKGGLSSQQFYEKPLLVKGDQYGNVK